MARIAVVGDVMLDAYYFCNVAGFSPEDDLAPKLAVNDKTYRPGGAANVACCLSRWGSQVGLFGVCGNDFSCETLSNLLRRERLERVYLLSLPGRRTTCKTRLVTPRARQAIRLDEECTDDLSPEKTQALFGELSSFDPEVVVVSDYAKGVVTRELMHQLNQQSSRWVIVVDPKTPNLDFYGPVFAVTPNEQEFEAFKKAAWDPMSPSCKALNVIVTYAGHGSRVFNGALNPKFDIPVRFREIGDPAGCGDAFLAALVYSMCSASTFRESCLAASAAGALAFDMLGVACPTWEQVEKELTEPEYKEVRDGDCGTDSDR